MSFGLVGISTAETGRYSSFYNSLSTLIRPEGTRSAFKSSAVISENRNVITIAALDIGADWVLYLDDDHVLKPDTLMRLLDSGKDVISAHYTQRQPPFNSVLMDELPDGTFMWHHLDSSEQGIIPVDVTGAGCLLVRRRVLEALTKPYWTLGQINPVSWGDDLDFCRRVRKAGFQVFCDLDNRIWHTMTGVVEPQWDDRMGWTSVFVKDPLNPEILARWPMPLKGEVNVR